MSKVNLKENLLKGKRPKKSAVVSAAVVAAAVGILGFIYLSAAQRTTEVMAQTDAVKTAALEKTSLTDYIAVSGTIYSGNSQNVYTTQSYPIKEIYVEVGDKVKAGDVLAVLDMTNLDYDIQKQELDLSNAKKSTSENQQSVSNSIQNAEMSVATSELNLQKQQLNFDILTERLEKGTSTELINAQNSIDSTKLSLDSAETDLVTKTRDYETSKVLFGVGGVSQYELDQSLQAMEDATTARDTALSNYDKAVDTYNRTLTSLEQDLATAEKDLENAKLSLQSSQNSLSQARAKSGTTTSSVGNQEISLTKLKEQRLEAEIISPIDGTVTVVNATVGMTGAGSAGSGSSGSALFVVEDMDDLYVSTSIKEFRVGEVSVGQQALVTTDGTSDRAFEGYLSFIAPTATEASSTSNVEFEVNVQLTEVDPDLRIGMNAYANIILEAREDIFAVAYDAVVTGLGGGSVVYALENGVVVEIPVETGMETDTSMEISGGGLREGMTIFLTPSAVTPGEAYVAEGGQAAAGAAVTRPEGAEGTRPDGEQRTRPEGAEGGERPSGMTPPEGGGFGGPPAD